MADDFKIRIITDDFQEGLTGGSSTGGGAGGASAIGLGAKLGAGIAIATSIMGLLSDAVSGVLKPVMSLVKGIFKLIAELLRPIVDILIIVLKPILMLIKPLIQMFRTMMAPFMQIAREMGSISQGQMQAGDTTGAMQTSMEAFKAVIGPFIVASASIFLQLATAMLVTNLTNLFGTVISLLFEPIAILVGVFSNNAAEKVREAGDSAKQFIVESGNGIINTVNGFIQGFTEDTLANMLISSEEKLAELNELYGDSLNSTHIEIPEGALAEQEKLTMDGMNAINADTETGMNAMDSTVQTGWNKVDNTLADGLASIEETFKKFVESLKDISDDLPSGGKSDRGDKKWRLDSFTVPLGLFGPRIGFGRG